jgi:hypothetical protein
VTFLEGFTIAISGITILGAIAAWITSWRASNKEYGKKIIADYFGYASTSKSAQSSMKKEFNEQERETVTRIVWKYSGIPLIRILKTPEDRYNIYQGLADPSEYPWDKKESKYTQ